MNRNSKCGVSKIAKYCSLNSKVIIDGIKERENWIFSDEREDILTFNINGNPHTIVLSEGFLNTKANIGYCTIFSGDFKTVQEAAKNHEKILLSFPIWLLSDSSISEMIEEEQNYVKEVKKMYVMSCPKSASFIFNPKFASMNTSLVVPLLKNILPSSLYYLIDDYVLETKSEIESMNLVIETALEGFDYLTRNPKKLKGYKSSYNNLTVFNHENATYLIYCTDSNYYYIKQENEIRTIWFFNSFDYYQYDKKGNPVFEQKLNIDEINKDQLNFINWLENQPSKAIWNNEIATKDSFMSEDIDGAYIGIGLQVQTFKEFFGFKKDILLKTSDDLLNHDLDFSSRESLYLDLFFANSSFKWTKEGFLTNESQIIPYKKRLNPLLPLGMANEEPDYLKPCLFFKNNSEANILKVPKNINKSLIPIVKEAYEWLINSNTEMSEDELQSLKNKLNTSGVL